MRCIFSTTFHLLWNREYTDVVQQTWEVWQGDLIPPPYYISLLHLERPVHRIQNEVDDSCGKPFKMSRNGTGISHLFFAKDMLLFAESSSSKMKVIKDCLDNFAKASGLRINFQKSSVYFSPNCNKDEAAVISGGMGIPISDNLGRYLGMQVVHGWHSKLLYSEMLEKFNNRMEG